MPRYRKKPVEVEAVCLVDDAHWQEIGAWCGSHRDFTRSPHAVGDTKDQLPIETLEGTMWASVGDYIIRGIKGEFYPCKPDIFEATYEPVEEDGR